MPRTAEQFERIRQNRINQILDVALELFSAEGYEGTSIARIAEKAGISKGLMYNYFTSKEAMLKAIVERSASRIAGFFDPDHDGQLTKDEMHYLIDAILDAVKANQPFYRLLSCLLMQPQILEKNMPELSRIGDPLLMMLSNFFRQQAYPDPEAQAYLFAALLNGVSMNYIQNPHSFPVERVRQAIHRLFEQS